MLANTEESAVQYSDEGRRITGDFVKRKRVISCVFILTCCVMCLGQAASRRHRQSEENHDSLIRKYWRIREHLGWGIIQDMDRPDIQVSGPRYSQSRFTTYYRLGSDVSISLDVRTGELFEVINWPIRKRLKNLDHKTPRKSAMSQEEILKIARDFIETYFPPLPEDVAAPVLTYHDSGESAGAWQVVWPRIQDGHPYQTDRLILLVSEEWGPYAYSRAWRSKSCLMDRPLSRKTAFSIAENRVMLLLHENLRHNVSRIVGVHESRALIMNRQKMVDGKLQSTPEVYLAWVFGLRTQDASDRELVFQIIVDAHTGEVAGEDVKELK